MADDVKSNGASQPAPVSSPSIQVQVQYIKDLSFENPRAPRSLQQTQKQPSVDVQIDVRANRLAENTYEVLLSCTVKAANDDGPLFLIELVYAGVFILTDTPEEHLHPLLLIECPRLLFPFARNVIAEITRDGGLPPLLLQPIDFTQLYRRSLQQQAEEKKEPSPAPA